MPRKVNVPQLYELGPEFCTFEVRSPGQHRDGGWALLARATAGEMEEERRMGLIRRALKALGNLLLSQRGCNS